MNRVTGLTSCFVVAGALLAGCHNEDTSPKSEKMSSTTMSMPTTRPVVSTAGPAALPEMKESDMTHMLMMDTPVFGEMPMGDDAKPMMMLKKDTKVMVMTPRGKYTLVTTVGGQKGYVTTAALMPLGK